jgi:hypothetical protein
MDKTVGIEVYLNDILVTYSMAAHDNRWLSLWLMELVLS